MRFRVVREAPGGAEAYVAWFEPRHRIVRLTASFFERRFPSMRWSILTPDECVHWEGTELRFTDGVTRAAAPEEDELESFWLTYYASTFNPARVRVSAMRAEMPLHYWRNMPETRSIDALLRGAPSRLREMIARAPSIDRPGEEPDRRPRVTAAPAPAAAPSREPPENLRPQRIPGIRVGVAGWDYPDWAGKVYPTGRAGVRSPTARRPR